jgi:outer membrane protein, protease secretion system
VRHPFTRRLLVSALATSFLLQTIPASAIGLIEAYESALQNDPTYRGAVHENEAGKQNVNLGRANLLPSVSMNYTTTHNRADITQPGFTGAPVTSHPNYDSDSGSLSLRQPLLNMDGLARYRQGVAQTEYSESVLSSRKQDLLLRLVGAYADAQYAEYQLALVESQRDTYAEQMHVNERMFQRGEGTRTDVLETRAKLDVAEAQVIEARDNVTVARNTLAGIVGRDVTELDPLSDDFRVKPLQPAAFEDWKNIALANNPDIDAQRHAVEITRQEVNKNRAGHLPRIDFIASLSKGKSETLSTLNQDASTRTVGFQLSMPIFSGGAIEASTSQAAANFEKAKDDVDAKTSQVLVELRKQYSQTLSGMTKIDALVKAVQSATLLVEATRQSIKGGVRINLDLLNAQQQLYAAKRDLAQGRYNYLISYLRLRAAAGTLSGEDVRAVAGYFERRPNSSPATTSSGATMNASVQDYGSSVVMKSNAAPIRLLGQKAQPESANAAYDDVLKLVNAWTQAWSAQDLDAYLGFYAGDFQPEKSISRDAWAEERRNRIKSKNRIVVQAESPEVTVNGDAATVKFRQIYKSDGIASDTRKTLVLVKQSGAWKIRQETTAG